MCLMKITLFPRPAYKAVFGGFLACQIFGVDCVVNVIDCVVNVCVYLL